MKYEEQRDKSLPVKMIVASAVFTALIAVGAKISISGPVPFTLQNFFVMLTVLFLGPVWGTVSIAVYILCGLVGLPVFALQQAGIAYLAGPTAGYLIGYLPAVFLAGLIARSGKSSIKRHIIALIGAAMIVYVSGAVWLKTSLGLAWVDALAKGVLPFLPFDAIKIVAAVFAYEAVRPLWINVVESENNDAGNKESRQTVS